MSSFTAAPSSFAAAWMVITRDWFAKSNESKGSQSESAAELLRRAEVYASTQPGYAADLRAAAQRVMNQG